MENKYCGCSNGRKGSIAPHKCYCRKICNLVEAIPCPCEVFSNITNAPVDIQTFGRDLGLGQLDLVGDLCPSCMSNRSSFRVRVRGDFTFSFTANSLEGITCRENYFNAFGSGTADVFGGVNANYNLTLVEAPNNEYFISLTVQGEIINFNFSGFTQRQNVIRRSCS